MIERAYTVTELDELRTVLRNKYLFGYYNLSGPSRFSRQYKEAELNQIVEEQARTHMIAGHTASDLLKSEQEAAS